MTTGLRTLLTHLKEKFPAAEIAIDHEETLRHLLQSMLTPIRRTRDTPLQFEIDSSAIVNAALAPFAAGPPESTPFQPSDWNLLTRALDSLIERSLLTEESSPPVEEERPPSTGELPFHPLAAWLGRLFTSLRSIDHRALPILALRIEGYRDRDIAEKLGTGLRLVQRITREIHAHRKAASDRC